MPAKVTIKKVEQTEDQPKATNVVDAPETPQQNVGAKQSEQTEIAKKEEIVDETKTKNVAKKKGRNIGVADVQKQVEEKAPIDEQPQKKVGDTVEEKADKVPADENKPTSNEEEKKDTATKNDTETKKKKVTVKKGKQGKKSTSTKKKLVKTKKSNSVKKTGKHKKRIVKKKKVEETKLCHIDKPRYFKLVYEDRETGRFSGSKPKQAANKALTSIVKLKEKNGEKAIDVDIEFLLKECTRWNKKKCKKGPNGEKIVKVYKYVGKRVHLTDQIPVDHKQEDTNANILTSGKVTKEVPLANGDVKYYIEQKNKVKGDNGKMKEVIDNIIVKKSNVIDGDTKKPTGEFKYAIVNEIKYKFTNKVQKYKTEKVSE